MKNRGLFGPVVGMKATPEHRFCSILSVRIKNAMSHGLLSHGEVFGDEGVHRMAMHPLKRDERPKEGL